MTDRELLMQAAAALLTDDSNEHIKVVEAIDAHLAQPEQNRVLCGWTPHELNRIKGMTHEVRGVYNEMQLKIYEYEKLLREKNKELAMRRQPTDQEPVAWMTINPYGDEDDIWYENPEGKLLEGWEYKPLYTTPPQRKPLTDERIDEIGVEIFGLDVDDDEINAFARAIEAAHNIKKSG